MTVLLVHVPVGFEEAYPLALAAIAAPLLAAGHRVEGLDAARVGLRGLEERLERGDVTIVGVSVWSASVAECAAVGKLVRAARSRPVLVFGGPHATLRPDELQADVIVIGEGERAFLRVVEDVAAGRTPSPRVRVEPADLAELPPLDRTVFAVSAYHREHRPSGRRYASDVTSRGCQYRCAFCSSPELWGRQHRFRPAEQVVESWRRLEVDHGVHGVLVEDDLFTQRRSRVMELAEALIRAQRPVTFEIINGVRPETLDEAMLDLLHQAGCTRLSLSLESSSPEQLEAMGRSPDIERARSVARFARGLGIGVTGYFMLGLPGETAVDRRATFDWACSLPLDMAHFSVASAWPGTTWTVDELSDVPSRERAGYYAAWYLHPVRAMRAARMLGVRVSEIPDVMSRLANWMAKPLEQRRTGLVE